MQTAKMIYIAIWLMLVLPVVGFNLKRMFPKSLSGKRRLVWGYMGFVVALVALVSVFLFRAYQVTLNTRYEIFAERYITEQCEYITQQIDFEQYKSDTADMRLDTSSVDSLENELIPSGGTSTVIRFQISGRILPSTYANTDVFPTVDAIDSENPIFIMYVLDDAKEQTYYLVELIQNEDGSWCVGYNAKATEAQIDIADNSMPSMKNGKWYYISA